MARKLLWISTLPLLVTLALAADVPLNLERALVAQEQLTLEQPGNANAHNDLGNLLVLATDHRAAEAAYRRALELEPENTSARFNLALLLQQTDDQRAAVEELNKVLDYAPDYAWAHYQIGVYHDSKGDRVAAVDAYAQAFALDPQLTFSRNNPHIIDNRWVTEALIRAQHYRDQPSTHVPRLYGDPLRIKELMLDEEEMMAEPAAAEGIPEKMEIEGAGEGFARRGVAPRNATTLSSRGEIEDETGAGPRASRRLTREDIDSEGSGGGQVIGGVAVGRQTISAPGGVPRQNRGSARVRTRTTPRPNTTSRTSETARRGTARPRFVAPAAPGRTPPANRNPTATTPPRPRVGGPGYRPSRISNSRLQLELLPAEESGERVASLVPKR